MGTIDENSDKYDGYRRTLKYLGMFGGAQGVSMFLNMVRNKFASVMLGTAGLSIIALFNRTIQMFSDFTNLSLSFSAIRKMSDTYENGDVSAVEHCVKVIRSIACFTGVAGMLLMFLLSPLINRWIFDSNQYYMSRFLLLTPVIFFMAVSGGETAILRGIKQFSKVAFYNIVTAFMSLIVAVSLYWAMGIGGIFPAIFFIAFFQMCLLLYLSLPHYSYRVSPFSVKILKEGVGIVKLGAGFIYATILTSFALWLICALLSELGDGTTAGLFNTGFAMITLLPGILFASMDSEYFPRISGVAADFAVRDRMINEQVEIQLLLQSPCLMAFAVALTVLIPLLSAASFAPSIPMAQAAMFGMFMRTMTYPISFLALSKNDTLTFLIQESVYNFLMIVFVIAGYSLFGLLGVGIGISFVHATDFFVVYGIAKYKYGFVLSRNVVKFFMLQMPLFILVLFSSLTIKSGIYYWLAGISCVLVSSVVSIYMLQRQSKLFNVLLKRLKLKR